MAISDERALWDSVKDSRDANELQAYLAQFPKGLFATVAAIRIRAMGGTGPVANPQVAPKASGAPATEAVPMVEAKVSTGVVTRELDVPAELRVQPGQGVLEIVPPPGKSLTVDGAARAAATRVILPVAEGTHDVRVGEQSKQIQVRSSRLTQVVFDTP